MQFKLTFFLLFTFIGYAQVPIPNLTKQLLVVTSKDFFTPIAELQAYEKVDKQWQKRFTKIQVNLGRNGLGWGKGLISFNHEAKEPVKKEGDGKAPAGLFSLDMFFGYEKQDFNFNYKQVSLEDLCIDDSSSSVYNQLIQSKTPQAFKSFEYMKREDRLYALGITVGHNKEQVKEAGSCIFIHVQRAQNAATAGCTSMQEKRLYQLMKWLDKRKHPLLLQLPLSYLKEGFN